MIIAIWIIAVCEIIRMAQNAIQLMMMRGNNSKYNTACDEFVKSLKETDKEFFLRLVEEAKKANDDT